VELERPRDVKRRNQGSGTRKYKRQGGLENPKERNCMQKPKDRN